MRSHGRQLGLANFALGLKVKAFMSWRKVQVLVQAYNYEQHNPKPIPHNASSSTYVTQLRFCQVVLSDLRFGFIYRPPDSSRASLSVIAPEFRMQGAKQP